MWATHGRPFRATVYRGCSAWTHRCASESRMTLKQRANPWSSWVESWCDGRGRGRSREKRVCVWLRMLTPLLYWKRCSSSQSYPFSFVSFAPFVPSVPLVPSKSLKVYPQDFLLRAHNPSPCSTSLRTFLVVDRSVAIQLVHAFENVDQL